MAFTITHVSVADRTSELSIASGVLEVDSLPADFIWRVRFSFATDINVTAICAATVVDPAGRRLVSVPFHFFAQWPSGTNDVSIPLHAVTEGTYTIRLVIKLPDPSEHELQTYVGIR